MLSALGAALTGAGVLILLFVAYQLWGTGLYTARQQDSLRSEFKQKAHIEQPASSTTSTTVDPQHLPPAPPTGDAVANIRIPKIGVDKYVVQGVGEPDLRITADSRTWLGFLAKERSLVWALIRREIRLKGSPRLLVAFGRCFPS